MRFMPIGPLPTLRPARVHQDRMGLPSHYAPLFAAAFFGIAAAATAVGAAACKRGGQGPPGGPGARAMAGTTPCLRRRAARSPRTISPVTQHWNIRPPRRPGRHRGLRRAGQRAVRRAGHPVTCPLRPLLPGQRVHGWAGYRGDEARLLWKSGHGQGDTGSAAGPSIRPTKHRGSQMGAVPDRAHPRLARGLLPAPARRGERGPALFVPVTVRSASYGPVRTVIKNRGGDLAGVQHLGWATTCYNGPVRGGRLQQPGSLAVSLDRPYDAKRRVHVPCYHERIDYRAWPIGPACRWPTSPAWTIDADPHLLGRGPRAVHRGPRRVLDSRRSGRMSRRAGTRARTSRSWARTRCLPADPDWPAPGWGSGGWSILLTKTSYLQDPMYGKNKRAW